MQGLLSIKKSVSKLNPDQVRQLADRFLRVAICAGSTESYQQIEDFLLGGLAPARRDESRRYLHPDCNPPVSGYDLVIYDAYRPAPPGALVFRPDRTERFVKTALDRCPETGVVLARAFHPFRQPFIERVITQTAKENTYFSLATALPDIVPSIIELPWAIAEFASDTAFITANQLKMAFLIAAASDRQVGYREQKAEIAMVIASAFGWRAVARQLIGKIPFGGGLIAKAAVAYAGTRVVGLSLERLYSIGYTYSRDEREQVYSDALRQGRKVAGRLLSYLRPDLVAKYANQAAQRHSRG